MRLLLDSHAFLWWLADDPRLTAAARNAIADPASIVHVSAASLWEIGIKAALGRLKPGRADVLDAVGQSGLVELPVTSRHAMRAAALPWHHNDPFDRMLVAQAELEALILVSRDRALAAYGVEILPA